MTPLFLGGFNRLGVAWVLPGNRFSLRGLPPTGIYPFRGAVANFSLSPDPQAVNFDKSVC